MITNEALLWDSEDIAIWRQFLQTRTGQRLLPKVAEAAPPLLATGDTNSILIRAGEVRGVQDAIRTLLFLAQEEPVVRQASENYPNLLDDKQWEDKEKIQIPT